MRKFGGVRRLKSDIIRSVVLTASVAPAQEIWSENSTPVENPTECRVLRYIGLDRDNCWFMSRPHKKFLSSAAWEHTTSLFCQNNRYISTDLILDSSIVF